MVGSGLINTLHHEHEILKPHMSGQELADFPEDGWPEDAYESETPRLSHVMVI